jgi:CDP-glucose 4,6-dehydratase
VLDALAGYLLLAERLTEHPARHARAWNFGPDAGATVWTAARVAEAAALRFGRGSWRRAAASGLPEAPVVGLSAERARRELGWRPRLDTAAAVTWTVDGYRAWLENGDTGWLIEQIHRYQDHGVHDADAGTAAATAAAAAWRGQPPCPEPAHAVA